LPDPPTDKQYQLWALLDGKPVDAGTFNVNSDSIQLQEVRNIANAQAFAITLEHKGGVRSPTL
jgi:anti-sigma-K factor RskA